MVLNDYFHKLVGKQFNKLTVQAVYGLVADKTGKRRTLLTCICECGTMRLVLPYELTKEKIKSCKNCSCVRKPRLTDAERIVRKKEFKQYSKQYRQDNKEEISKKKKLERDQAKIEGLLHYGNKCSCCGEPTKEFLTLEHLNGAKRVNGRRRSGKEAWLQAKRAKWPSDVTILCFNCNCAKGIYGNCPHKKV